MSRRAPRRLMAVLATSAALGITPSASAAVSATFLPQALATAAFASAAPCALTNLGAQGLGQDARVETISKSAALLGGAPSALERMRLQQAGTISTVSLAPATTRLAAPAAPSALSATICPVARIAEAQPALVSAIRVAPVLGSNDFLASKRLAISRTSFDADWSRVRKQALTRSEASRLVGLRAEPDKEGTLERVNTWVNRHIRYAEDSQLYGRSDHWAAVRTTLKRRAGDCEDIAIAKMQMLAALGVPRDAMYLTVARDLVRNADHALLVVKQGDRFWVLDNASDSLLDGSARNDYRPIYSFSAQGKWLHGYAPT